MTVIRGNAVTPPPLTYLYAPADRPELVAKALAGGADAVLVDLEDAVAPDRKDQARADLKHMLHDVPPGRKVQVRINAPDSPWFADDLRAFETIPESIEVRLPKAEDPTAIDRVAGETGRPVNLLLESALGVELAFELAGHQAVSSIGLGEADLRSQLRVGSDSGLLWARSRIVVAAQAAELPAPAMSAYTQLADEAGLVASCKEGRNLGFLGRTAIHPRQLVPIRDAFRPTAIECEKARVIVERVDKARVSGKGTVVLPDGTFLDVAMVEHARMTLAVEDAVARADHC